MVHAIEGEQEPRGMTHDELLALPVSFPLDVANRALDLGRTTGFVLAKRGAYPVRVLRLGRQYRVTRYDLLRYLGLDADGCATDGSSSSAEAA
ncbi:hypothetical protein K378_04066 [Streptomyces sp. Amel2xB2]|uniref:hypothetical protein n=1 Tax=Streptomyces sp. Amel2xB2 TaxID=1305829 RepID=UPI000DBA9DF9|nr:hypothetical protein [Streptomyces sp. Amel2xB2]RAJ61706.1 hypothetical protein K378_04066 [Streptomyces sp. Amel2xB2]